MGRFTSKLLALKGIRLQKSFDDATREPVLAQAQYLRRVVAENADTVYGKRHGFASMTDVEAYRALVPTCCYSDIEPYVVRMMNGEKRVLTRDDPVMFSRTSGTTSQPKYIPITPTARNETARLTHLWAHRSTSDHAGLLRHRSLCLMGAAIEGQTSGGVPYGSASGMIHETSPKVLHSDYAIPFSLARIDDYDLKYYLIARMAFAENISCVVTPNASSLLKLAQTAIQHQEEIIRAVHDGTVGSQLANMVSSSNRTILDEVAALLEPCPKSARRLEAVVKLHGHLSPKHCWPNLQLVGCWLGGSAGFQVDKLNRYFNEQTAKRDLGYLASEGSMSLPFQDGTASGILALQNGFYEFIPEEEIESQNPHVLLCHQLEVGRTYAILMTNASGLYRYDIKDLVKVTGFYNRTPLIAFVRKSENMLNITGEKLHLNHALEAMTTLRQQTGIEVKQFRFVPDHDQMRYEIYLDVGAEVGAETVQSVVIPILDAGLMTSNIEYQAKRASGRLSQPVAHIMDSTWEDDVRREYFSANKRDVQFKWHSFSNEPLDVDRRHIRHRGSFDRGALFCARK